MTRKRKEITNDGTNTTGISSDGYVYGSPGPDIHDDGGRVVPQPDNKDTRLTNLKALGMIQELLHQNNIQTRRVGWSGSACFMIVTVNGVKFRIIPAGLVRQLTGDDQVSFIHDSDGYTMSGIVKGDDVYVTIHTDPDTMADIERLLEERERRLMT